MTSDFEKRITSLENSLRFYKLAFSTLFITGLVVAISSFTNKDNQDVPDKIKAKAFEVVDNNGKVLVNLSSYNGNGSISTLDKEGDYLVDLVSNSSGYGNINLYDGKGKATVQLYNVKGGGGAIAVKNAYGTDALLLSLMTDGAGHISLNSSSGN